MRNPPGALRRRRRLTFAVSIRRTTPRSDPSASCARRAIPQPEPPERHQQRPARARTSRPPGRYRPRRHRKGTSASHSPSKSTPKKRHLVEPEALDQQTGRYAGTISALAMTGPGSPSAGVRAEAPHPHTRRAACRATRRRRRAARAGCPWTRTSRGWRRPSRASARESAAGVKNATTVSASLTRSWTGPHASKPRNCTVTQRERAVDRGDHAGLGDVAGAGHARPSRAGDGRADSSTQARRVRRAQRRRGSATRAARASA